MSEKRFVYGIINGSRQAHIKDCHTCKSATIDVYDDDFKYFVDLLNKLAEENRELRQTTKTQQIRIYCQDKEIQKLNEQLNQIPKNIREVWIE